MQRCPWRSSGRKSGSSATIRSIPTLRQWKSDLDLAGIRDESVVKELPEDEQKACLDFWAEVDQLLKPASP